MENEILRIRDLHTSFFTRNGEVKAVNGVSLDVPPASVVGIVGESGCGKSMTARSIMGLVKYPGRVAGGSIELCSRELVGLSDREMCRLRGDEMSMIFQEPMTSLNPVVPVGKQVEEAVLLHRKVSRAEARSEALRMFERVGIPEPEKRLRAYPHELSGGLRQRVMIAMAMVCRPKLLIADEPTTALDVTVQAQILKLMRELRDETGMSIILISHDLGVIAELCDFVYVMYAGRIVEQAEVCELFDNPMHPYTRGLLRSVSALERGGERLDTIPGVVPNLLRLPAGCAFSLRCGECSEDCAARLPELASVNGTHLVRCHMAGGENRGQ
jgi:peptide/nickel transport system ATP-binding protein